MRISATGVTLVGEMARTYNGGSTMDSALRSVADRLGFIAYALLVSGGRPDWNVILGQPGDEDSGGDRVEARTPQDAFTDTVPYDASRRPENVGSF
jgi:hypothetical protein